MEPIDDREYHFLLQLLDTHDKKGIHDFVIHSTVYKETKFAYVGRQMKHFPILTLKVDPETFKKYHHLIEFYKQEIGVRYGEIANLKVHDVKAHPDLTKLHILQNELVAVDTPWQNINDLQKELVQNLRQAASTSNYQNIGNSSRIVLQKLASVVFDPNKHIAPPEISLDEGKFKNRLHTYIKIELAGEQNQRFRDYVNSIIVATEMAIDLSNQVTHDTNTKYFFAEACVIGVVTTVGLVKLVALAKK